MPFLFGGYNVTFPKKSLVHHAQEKVVHAQLGDFSVYLSQNKEQAIAKRDDCLVVIYGSVENCSAQQLLQRYLDEGIDVCTHLFGQFIIVIVHKERVFLIRDPIGHMSVFYKDADSFSFCTDPLGLASPQWNKKLHVQQLFFGYLPFGIQTPMGKRLTAGSWLSKLNRHRARQVRYYRFPQRRDKTSNFWEDLYQKTFSRVLSDSSSVTHMIPQKSMTTIALLSVLRQQGRNIELNGWEGEEWIRDLAQSFGMSCTLFPKSENLWDSYRSAVHYGGGVPCSPTMMRLYDLSSYLREKEVYFDFDEVFGGDFLQRFSIMHRYFPGEGASNFLRSCDAGFRWKSTIFSTEWSQEVVDQLHRSLSSDLGVLDGVLRFRLHQWAANRLLPQIRAFFPLAQLPFFDERVVRLGLSLPLNKVYHKGKVQPFLMKHFGAQAPKSFLELEVQEYWDDSLEERCVQQLPLYGLSEKHTIPYPLKWLILGYSLHPLIRKK